MPVPDVPCCLHVTSGLNDTYIVIYTVDIVFIEIFCTFVFVFSGFKHLLILKVFTKLLISLTHINETFYCDNGVRKHYVHRFSLYS